MINNEYLNLIEKCILIVRRFWNYVQEVLYIYSSYLCVDYFAALRDTRDTKGAHSCILLLWFKFNKNWKW